MMISTISRSILLLALLAVLHLGKHKCKSSVSESETHILKQLLNGTRNDPNAIPTTIDESSGKPVQVSVSLYLINIEGVDEVKMQFSPHFYFRQKWIDSRLKFDDMKGQVPYVTVSDVSRIWRPDTLFSNELNTRFHLATKSNALVRIAPSGEVFYSVLLSSTLENVQ